MSTMKIFDTVLLYNELGDKNKGKQYNTHIIQDRKKLKINTKTINPYKQSHICLNKAIEVMQKI